MYSVPPSVVKRDWNLEDVLKSLEYDAAESKAYNDIRDGKVTF